MLKGGAGNAFISIDVCQFPARMAGNKILIMVFLQLIGRSLSGIVRRNPDIGAYPHLCAFCLKILFWNCRDDVQPVLIDSLIALPDFCLSEGDG